MPANIEETKKFIPIFRPAFHYDRTVAPDLIVVSLEDYLSGKTLLTATMDKKAWEKTLATKKVHLYSRSAKKIRCKGATESGNYLEVVSIIRNCNSDSLLIKVKRLGPDGGVCHLKDENGKHLKTCFSWPVL